jgi:spore coat protein CotH
MNVLVQKTLKSVELHKKQNIMKQKLKIFVIIPILILSINASHAQNFLTQDKIRSDYYHTDHYNLYAEDGTFLGWTTAEITSFANDTVIIKTGLFGIDESKKLVVVNQSIDEINAQWTQETGAIYLNERYHIESPVNEVQIGNAYQITNDRGESYQLYFTQLPLIFLTATEDIVDEPKIPAKFTMVESNSNTVASDIGIEIRGGSTQFMFAKKSYKIAFKEDATLEDNRDVSLLGMRSDDDWDLQAMTNEPLRMNEKTSFDIWRKINTLHYQSSEKDALNSCRMEYAELFLNGKYQGVYCVSEPVDRKLLKLKKYSEDKGIRGELYKSSGWGPTVFTSCPPYDNSSLWWTNSDGYGYESIYPDEVNPDWKGLHDFVHFVMNSSDMDFYSQYPTYFDVDNAVDYFIFLNVASAEDNYGNNLFVAKYDEKEPYFYVPWDVDASFGNNWEGKKREATDDIFSNGFFDRLLKDHPDNNFNGKLKTKWEKLRKDWLTAEGLMGLFRENYEYLLQNGVYEREESAWQPDDNYYFDSQYMEYMQGWITARLRFLDQEYDYTGIREIQNKEIQYPCNIRIYNINGQLLKTTYATQAEDCRFNLEKGIYIIHFQNSDVSEVKKWMVR